MRYGLLRSGLLLLLLTAISACSGESEKSQPEKAVAIKAVAILDEAERIDLYSLEPVPEKKPENTLRGWGILGKVRLDDVKARNQVLTALKENVGRGTGAACFWPRHALRASLQGKTVDVLICFECGWVYVYDEDREERTVVTIDRAARPVFDKILKAAGVALGPGRGK